MTLVRPPDISATQQKAQMALQLVVTRQLQELLPLLAEAGIVSVLLKGTGFWSFLYGWGERNLCDIDLLVRQRDIAVAEQILLSLGYQQNVDSQKPVTTREFYERSYQPLAGTRVPVELHTSICHPPRYRFDPEELFTHSQPCELQGLSARRLSLEDSLLHLAIHRTIHNYGFDRDLRNIQDAALLCQQDVCWTTLQQRARRWGCQMALWILLDSATKGYGAKVPQEVRQRLFPDRLRLRYLQTVMCREQGAWVYRWPQHPRWRRRLVLFPLILDRPDQYQKSLRYYAKMRLRDRWERRRHPVRRPV